tara:strand:- start:763 stop:1134 length:372 start_codon:yes stop_codon:yes gene_type:complete
MTSPKGGFGNVSFNAPDFSAGGLLYNNNFWFGFSSHHMNRPAQSFTNESIQYPIKYSFITGYKISLKSKNPRRRTTSEDKMNLFPIFHYKFQGKSDQIETGLIFIDTLLKVGMIYRGIPSKKI